MSLGGAKYVLYQGQNYKKIRQKYNKRSLLFEDPEFPAQDSSLHYSPKWQIQGITWLRPPEITQDPHLFVNGASSSDITQGRVGNCWFVAACSSLAQEKTLWRQIVPDYKDQDWDPKRPEKYAGIFHFRFWRFGDWIDIVIDDRLPTINGELIFTHSRIKNEFWISLLEKAYAKLNGCYEALDGGNLSDALVDFTGGICENIELSQEHAPPNTNQQSKLPSVTPSFETLVGSIPTKITDIDQNVITSTPSSEQTPINPTEIQSEPTLDTNKETNPPINLQQINESENEPTERDPMIVPPIITDTNAKSTNSPTLSHRSTKTMDDDMSPYKRGKTTEDTDLANTSSGVLANRGIYYCGDGEARKALFKVLLRETARKSLMSAAIDVKEESERETRTAQGLVRGHAYGITAVKKFYTKDTSIIDLGQIFKFRRFRGAGNNMTTPDGENEKTPEKFYMIRLKNPWGGKNEWTGPFSDGSPEWEKITPSQREKLGLVFEDDGEFWMTFDDFCANFTHLSICYVLNTSYFTLAKTWHEAILWAKWVNGPYGSKTDRAGGCVNYESFLQNPQCFLTLYESPTAREEVLFYLSQKDRRENKQYTSQNLTIGFSIFKVEENRMYRIHDIRYSVKVGQSDYINSRSIFLRCFLASPATYLVLPTTFRPGEQGDFMFRIYCGYRTQFSLAQRDYPKHTIFSGCVGYPTCVYRLHLMHAKALEKQNRSGSGADPYAIISCEKYRYTTRTIKDSQDPVWNESYIFYCKKRNSPIRVELWNANIMRDSFLGQATIHPQIDETTQQFELSLMGRGKKPSGSMPGTITVQLTASDNVKTFF